MKPAAFDGRRCVVKLTFSDQPHDCQDWWFLNENGLAELCFEDPGFDVDLYLTIGLPDMIHIYRGDVSLAAALAQERLKVH